MAIITNESDLEILSEGGRRLAAIIDEIAKYAAPGVSTKELNDLATRRIEESGDTPAFLGYTPQGSRRAFPAALCVSINEEVVHGIPNERERILRPGDIVTIDCGLIHKGLFTDMAVTVPIGRVDKTAGKLIGVAREALSVAIAVARVPNTTGSIGAMVEALAIRHGFSIPYELGGHGVGRSVHEEPFIPNYGKSGEGERLVPGMVLAIEPIICEGEGDIVLRPDGYTYATKDGKRTAQFEHTVRITDGDPEIFTEK